MRIYDVNGNEQTWDWLVANYGAVGIQQPDTDEGYYDVVELREKHDDSTFIAQVRDGDGNPTADAPVVFYWDTAPDLPDAGWLCRGVVGHTNANGDVGFGMGPGAYYFPPNQGPHKCWLYGMGVSSMLEGIGMLGGTNHNHFNVVYEWVEAEPEPPEPPPVTEPCDLSPVVEELERQTAELARVADAVTFIVEHWPFS